MSVLYCNKKKSLISMFGAVMFLLSVLLLQSCGNDAVTEEPVIGGNISGYFTGTAAVRDDANMIDLRIEDLEGMVSGGRFMFMSIQNVLLYDGVFTSFDGNDFKGTVKIYRDGVLISDTATVSGTVTSESSIEGTITGEVGFANGAFNLTYSLNNEPASLDRISKTEVSDFPYLGFLNGPLSTTPNLTEIGVSATGVFSKRGESSLDFGKSTYNFCVLDPVLSKILPISGINIYAVDITFSSCVNDAVNGRHTGFATTQAIDDAVLLVAFSNSLYGFNLLLAVEFVSDKK